MVLIFVALFRLILSLYVLGLLCLGIKALANLIFIKKCRSIRYFFSCFFIIIFPLALLTEQGQVKLTTLLKGGSNA